MLRLKTHSGLSVRDSLALKGVALMLLLAHHLFWIQKGLYDDIAVAGYGIVNEVGKNCKLCVAVFVFLSGYGLTVQTQERGLVNVRLFYRHRLLKLLVSYWFIWLLFVPIGHFFFGRTLEDSYHDWWQVKFLLDFAGLAFLAGFFGYNATWWFLSCIIVLYLSYPLLYRMALRYPGLTLFGGVVMALLPVPLMQYEIVRYALPFILGIRLAVSGLPEGNGEGKFMFLPWLMVCLLLFAERSLVNIPIFVDCLLCISLSVTYLMIPRTEVMERLLVFVGKHSMNIFLFHTFIFSHWFRGVIYSPRNPLLIFLFLLAVCLFISIVVEKIKKLLYVDRLLRAI